MIRKPGGGSQLGPSQPEKRSRRAHQPGVISVELISVRANQNLTSAKTMQKVLLVFFLKFKTGPVREKRFWRTYQCGVISV